MPDDFVLLESSDNFTFVVPRKVACASGMLKSMLDEDGQYSKVDRIILRLIVQLRSRSLRTIRARSSNGTSAVPSPLSL